MNGYKAQQVQIDIFFHMGPKAHFLPQDFSMWAQGVCGRSCDHHMRLLERMGEWKSLTYNRWGQKLTDDGQSNSKRISYLTQKALGNQIPISA